ncbi:DNA-(apurinic or apyrimidinic site) lyase 1 [Cyphellophora attinorum]|uniref:Apurinic-apyrimidinic endonuclease 1 n=1 Tax=Cyphellophora attinorum TaxID=1664694 RepID=A0A0N1HC96_9EURO|nr:DNA-(apurinic or apyrimidinic site) lyase 1 [Phialophora attinorum]KPI46022.1 DNA-(apurinic or apyrimidinic site) lyase 1 [Phialophora attinorum]
MPAAAARSSARAVPIGKSPAKRKASQLGADDGDLDKSPRTPTAKRVSRKVVEAVKATVVTNGKGHSSASESSLSDLSESEDGEVVAKPKRGKGKPAPTARAKKPKASPGKRAAKSEPTGDTHDLDTRLEGDPPVDGPAETPKRKRKTAAEKEAEAMPLAPRTTGLRMFVGAHTSIAKGVENAISNAVHIGGNSFACFLKSQRKWDNPSLQDTNKEAFRTGLITHKYDGSAHIVPHGSYLVNLATEDEEHLEKSYSTFLDDLHRCEALGIKHYNFHPGAAGKASMDSAIARIAANLNRALSATSTVVPLLENMASRGSVVGGRFSDLAGIIALIEPQHQHRIGVCIDTCHAFASGYDLRSPTAFNATLAEFDDTVGMKYLKALHLNDSKAPMGSGRDLHQNIGLGFLGLRAFHNVMNEPRLENLPLILETPCEKPDPKDPKGKKTLEDKGVWATEIKLLESLIGMDPEGTKFKKLEKELSDRGKAERATYQKAWDDKQAKEKKKVEKEREKGQKSVKDMFGGGTTATKKAKGMVQKRSSSTTKDSDSSGDLSELEDEEDD